MAQRFSDDKLRQATGKSWEQWFAVLDGAGARDMPHKDIARWVYDTAGLPGLWCQTVTVAYEQAIGRRVVGQNCYGEFTAGASVTLDGDLDRALEVWQHKVDGWTAFDDVALIGPPRVSSTPKWRYWRANLADGSKLSIIISAKDAGRSLLAVNHVDVGTLEASQRWKAYWKPLLRTLEPAAAPSDR